jgi:hypothetical protein
MVLIVSSFLLPPAAAQDSSVSQTGTAATDQTPSVEELAKLKQNPVSGLREVIVQAVVSPDMPITGKTAGNYSIQPVWPFALGENWRLVTYTILPVIQQPVAPNENSIVGLGDTLINLFFSPRKPGALIWGAGPAILLPTRTDPALGSNRLSLGPAALLYYPKGAWSAGVVLQNGWSLGGSGINQVNAFSAQYIFNYNLPKGWYLYSNSTISANWLANADDRWTVPVGGGFGKIFKIRKQAMSASIQAFSNVVTPRNGATWGLNSQFAFLFPSRK